MGVVAVVSATIGAAVALTVFDDSSRWLKPLVVSCVMGGVMLLLVSWFVKPMPID